MKMTKSWLHSGKCLAALAFLLAGPVGSAVGEDTNILAQYPEVILSAGSKPRYTVIDLDYKKGQPAYLLFDGDVTNGYKRMFVWSPGHEKYNEPVVARLREETQTYREITTESVEGDEAAVTTWTIKYRPETHGHTYRDYKTGELIEREPTLQAIFYFNVDLQVGPARRVDRKAGKYPFDIGIPGRFGTSDSWAKRPAIHQPWKIAYCTLSRTPKYDRKDPYIQCKAGLRFYSDRWNHFPVTVRQLPEGTAVKITIAPYLEQPVFERSYPVEEIFYLDIDIDIPFGWYRIVWEFQCDFFKANPLHANSDDYPMAFGPVPE